MLLAGFCMRGPYRYNLLNLLNPEVRFISLGYQEQYISPETLDKIKRGDFKDNERAYVAMWDSRHSEFGLLLREGRIDFLRTYPDFVFVNIFLEPLEKRAKFALTVLPLRTVNHYLLREI